LLQVADFNMQLEKEAEEAAPEAADATTAQAAAAAAAGTTPGTTPAPPDLLMNGAAAADFWSGLLQVGGSGCLPSGRLDVLLLSKAWSIESGVSARAYTTVSL
jgi:hypothetical protein